MSLRSFLKFGLGIASAAWSGGGSGPNTDLKVGDLAPPFSLPGSDGETYRLADYTGKRPVVLAWFPKAYTSGCTAECKSLRASSAAIRQFDVAYFTISVDDAATNAKYAAYVDADYPILADATKEVARAYGVLNRLGVASRWTFYIGPDGKILYIDKTVRTSTAGQDVAAKLAELGVAKR